MYRSNLQHKKQIISPNYSRDNGYKPDGIKDSANPKYSESGNWDVYWDDYGSSGSLEFCLELISGYIENYRQAKAQCLELGFCGGENWGIKKY